MAFLWKGSFMSLILNFNIVITAPPVTLTFTITASYCIYVLSKLRSIRQNTKDKTAKCRKPTKDKKNNKKEFSNT